jgi:hypothetical protein
MTKGESDVERELLLDRVFYGSCFWRVVDGKKVRVPPEEVTMDLEGRIITPMDNVQKLSDEPVKP